MKYLNPEDLTKIMLDPSTLSLVIINEYQVKILRIGTYNLTFNIYEYLEEYKYDIIFASKTIYDELFFMYKKRLIDYLLVARTNTKLMKTFIEEIIEYYRANKQIDTILTVFSELKNYLFEKRLYIIFKTLAELGFDIINNDEDRLLVLLNT